MRAFLRAVRTNALTIWTQAAYREQVVVRQFFGRLNILLNDPEAIHHVLVANATNYRRSRASVRILRPLTGSGLLLSEGDAWKVQRRTVAPALAPRVMPMLARHVVEVLDEFIPRLAARMDRRIDLLAEMQRLALDIAGRSMFSLEMEQYGGAIRDLLTEFADRHARPGLLDMLLPAGVPTWADLGRRRFQRRWAGLIDAILADRLKSPVPETPKDLLDLLRSARDPETGESFSRESLRDQVATLLLAGHETTAVTLFWALFLLAQSADDAEKIAQEAGGLALNGESATTDLSALLHTRSVINETLRLFPPAFTIVRESIAADSIGKLAIPPRSVIMIAPWVLHRHAALWPDPDAFLPSRFLPGTEAPARFSFLPFGMGPRVCVGAQFAMTEALLVLARLVRDFTFDVETPVTLGPVGIVTTQPDSRLMVSVRNRR
jgi:unspecific monooxygenase